MARKRRPDPVKPAPAETLTSEALTIAWLLAVFTTLACEVGAVLALLFGGPSLEVLGGLLLFAALVIGLASIGVGMVAKRYRLVPAPQGIAIFAMTVGLLPIVGVIVQTLR
jgi:hypothetical protein